MAPTSSFLLGLGKDLLLINKNVSIRWCFQSCVPPGGVSAKISDIMNMTFCVVVLLQKRLTCYYKRRTMSDFSKHFGCFPVWDWVSSLLVILFSKGSRTALSPLLSLERNSGKVSAACHCMKKLNILRGSMWMRENSIIPWFCPSFPYFLLLVTLIFPKEFPIFWKTCKKCMNFWSPIGAS